MSDVFISYAHTADSPAKRIAETLRELGFAVWLDADLPAHRNFTLEIEKHLAAAKAVVVLWCADAVRSEWVQSEADRARQDGKLVQLRLDDAVLPMPFDRIQCADLRGCDFESHDWRKVVESLGELTGGVAGVDAQIAPAAPTPPAATMQPSSASIAVMPFANLSNDPEQTYFVEGMVEDIVAALSRYRSLSVMAAGASMASHGRPLSPQAAARELGVRYLLEGSVRKAALRVRITLHLIDAESGAELWTDRLDGDLSDIFALQDSVAECVAGVVEATVQDADIRRIASRPTTNLGSYDLAMRALFLFRTSRRDEMEQSVELLDQAIALDPDYAVAISQACVCLRQIVDHGWTDDPEAARRKGLDYAEQALRLASDDARVIAQVAISLPGLEGHTSRALPLIERALAINPISGFIQLAAGSLYLRHGNPDKAAEHLELAMRLDPISSNNGFMRTYLASARFQQRRFDEALALFQTTTYRLPVSYLILASLHGHLGQIDQGRQALAEFERVHAGSVDDLAKVWFPGPENRALLLEGLKPLGAGSLPAS